MRLAVPSGYPFTIFLATRVLGSGLLFLRKPETGKPAVYLPANLLLFPLAIRTGDRESLCDRCSLTDGL
jgi:hypothetical protein